MTETRIAALTTCAIANDGGSISLGFTDATGNPTSLTLEIGQAGALAMTLPKLIEEALHKQFSDKSLRYTYPLGSWEFEQSTDHTTGIITLRTKDGFSVRFTILQNQQSDLGEALAGGTERAAAVLAN